MPTEKQSGVIWDVAFRQMGWNLDSLGVNRAQFEHLYEHSGAALLMSDQRHRGADNRVSISVYRAILTCLNSL